MGAVDFPQVQLQAGLSNKIARVLADLEQYNARRP
jgi:hypothetical protein